MPRKPKVTNRIKTNEDREYDTPTAGIEDIPEIVVADNESTPPSLKERFFSTFETAKEPKRTGRVSRQGQNDLIAKAMPTVFTAFILQISKNLVPDLYKPACPLKEEVEAILQPLFSILSRRIKVSVGASKDTIDAIACITAAFAYGTRALITVEIINKEVRKHDRRTISEQDNRTSSDTSAEAPTNHDHANSQNGYSSDTSGETQLFSDLFRRDVDGRRQMGLLDRRL